MKFTTIFWDWNGTVIDDLDISMRSINGLLSARGMKTFDTVSEYHNVFCFPVSDYYIKAGFDYSIEPFEDLAHEYIEIYNALKPQARVFDDVRDALQRLKKKGVMQVMLSASEKSGLVKWLDRTEVLKYFDDVIATDNIYARGKVDIATDWITLHPIDKDRAVLVGDTVHDAEVAEAMGIQCVIIPRGHSGVEDLKGTSAIILPDAAAFLKFCG